METSTASQDLLERLKKKEEKKKIENPEKTEKDYASKVIDGVEVVDVKAIPKKDRVSATKIDKFGIPEPRDRRTWDRI